MGIKQLNNDNLRKLPNEYGDVSVMFYIDEFVAVNLSNMAATMVGPIHSGTAALTSLRHRHPIIF